MTVHVEASISGRKVHSSGSVVFSEASSLTLNIGGFPLVLRFLTDGSAGTPRLNIQNEIGVTIVEVINAFPDGVSFGLRPFKIAEVVYELNFMSSLLANEAGLGHRVVHYTVMDSAE